MEIARTATLTSLAVLILGGGYLVADAADLVPGFITTRPLGILPQPFLSASPVAIETVADPIGTPDATAPMPSADAVAGFAQTLLADARVGPSTNVSVVDVATGTVLGDVAANDPQVPASATKLLTAVAALHDLGPDFRTSTTALWDEASSTLTLVGGGDALLAAGVGRTTSGAAEGADAVGYAGLEDLAVQVATVIGAGDGGDGDLTLLVDDSIFDTDGVNPTWPAYAWANGFVAKTTGLAVDAARINPDEYYSARHTDPSLAAGRDFAAALAARGIVVESPARGEAPAGSVEAGRVESAPLSDVVEYFLSGSENTIAETVSLVHAVQMGYPGTPAGAAASTVDALVDMGVDVTGLQLFDGAGFADTNQVSPALFTSVLVAALDAPNTRHLPDLLPISALEGTMEGRLTDGSGAGQVRAKSGSLTGVTALAGYLTTADGRLLAFSVLIDGMEFDPAGPRAAVDVFLGSLADCGC